MAQSYEPSPYTVGPTADDAPPAYAFPTNGSYAVPGPEGALTDGWWDLDGFSPNLHESPTGTPDANRLKRFPLWETRESEGVPQTFNERYRGEKNTRDKDQTFTDADGFERIAPENPNAFVARPRPSDVPENRPTMRMSPHRYIFLRAQDLPKVPVRTFNGLHFSMADHRREYPVLGMQAPPTRRNTYRIEPAPWDANINVVPADVQQSVYDNVQAVELPYASNRSGRLM